MSSGVHDGPKKCAVGDLTVEPDVLVERDERRDDGTEGANDVAEDCRAVSFSHLLRSIGQSKHLPGRTRSKPSMPRQSPAPRETHTE